MEQDPLASAAPVLQSGPGALDIGYKRMGIEQEAGKLAAAQKDALDKLKDAQKERNAAAFKIDAEVPFFTHKAAFAQDWKAEEDWLAQKMMDFDQGKGDDPMDPTSKAGIERQFRAQQLKLKTGYSKQMGDMYVKATDYIDKNYQNLKPGTKEKLDDWASNIENLNQGKVYDPIVGNIDLNKVVQGQLKELAKSTTGSAWIDPVTGQSHSFQTDQIIAPQVLAGIQGVLSDHYNREQAEYDAAEIAISDPVRYKRVVELAAKNNIPVADALIFDYAAPVYTMRSHTETVGQPSDGGSGAALAKGSLWFGKYLEDVMAGDYATEGGQSTIVGSDEEGYADIQAVEKDFPGWKGYTKEVPNNLRKDNTLKGFTWDDKVVYDPEAKTQVRTIRDIKKVAIDYEGKKFLVAVGPAGPGKANETVEVPFDQAESKLGPMILGHNKNLIAGQGAYDRAAETTGEGTRKGAGAQNIIKTPTTAPQPKAETPAEAWARKQKEAAAAKAGK